MLQKLDWTTAGDGLLHSLRANRMSWDHIANELKVSRSAAIERGKIIGAVKPRSLVHADVAVMRTTAREPLPAGHPDSWNLLTAGTTLEGVVYPGWRQPMQEAA